MTAGSGEQCLGVGLADPAGKRLDPDNLARQRLDLRLEQHRQLVSRNRPLQLLVAALHHPRGEAVIGRAIGGRGQGFDIHGSPMRRPAIAR